MIIWPMIAKFKTTNYHFQSMLEQTLLKSIFSKTILTLTLLLSTSCLVSGSIEGSFEVLGRRIKSCPKDSILFYLNAQKSLASTDFLALQNHLNWSGYYRKQGNADSAFYYTKQAGSYVSNEYEEGLIFKNKGWILASQFNWKASKIALLYASSLFTKPKDIASCYQIIADNYINSGISDSSYHYLKLAKAMSIEAGEEDLMSNIIYSIGHYHEGQTQYDSAALSYKTALGLFRKRDNTEGTSKTYGQIGNICLFQGKWDEAEAAFRMERKYLKQLFLPRNVIVNQTRLAIVFSQTRRNDSALVYYERALEASRKQKITDLESNCLNNLAIMHVNSPGGKKTGLDYFKQSLLLSLAIGDQGGALLTYGNIGWYFLEEGMTDSSFVYFHLSLAEARAIDNPERIISCFQGLTTHHTVTRQTDSILHYTELYYELKDSIRSLEIEENLTKIQGDYELEIATLGNEKLQFQVNETRMALRIKRVETSISIGLVLVLVLSLFPLLYIFRQRARLKQRSLALTEAELAKKTAEEQLMVARLDQSKTTIIEKNRIIQKFETYASSPEAQEGLIKSLATDQDWAKFMVEFNLLYPQVFSKMEGLPVKLSKNDYRITALLKLKLTNKEMAEILHITLSGVKAAKSRLRAKIKPLVPDDL